MLTRELLAGCLARPPCPIATEDEPHLFALAENAKITHAAVLVPLVHRESAVHVLLTQRTPHLYDHPSQISFPGGRVEAGDSSRVETALREAEEEIGLPRSRIDVIGRLPDYEIPSGFRITPIVGWIEAPYELALHAFEVAGTFEVPLSFVLDPDNHHRRSYDFDGRHRHYMAMPYEGRYIWGATAGMLYSLYRQLAQS